MTKNIYIAMILSLLVTGLGNIYNGLYKRGIAEFAISIVMGLLNFVIPYLGLIGLAWLLYVLYDTYGCTTAINENKRIPLFVNNIDLQ